MHDQRKPSLSSTPAAFITKGILSHTTSVSTPDEVPATSSLGGYFSLSRSASNKKRRPSAAEVPPVYLYQGPPPAGPPPSSSGKGMFSRSNTSRGGDFVSASAAAPNGGMTISSSGGGGSMATAPQSPNALYETLHELATKRIATLDYLRRAHEGRVYWFNTMLFTKADLQRTVYHDHKKLTRRANNYFILGNSLPAILDLGTSSPLDYLKAFNHLLQEYETHIALPPSRQPTRGHSSSISSSHSHHHPISTSALSLGRLPKLFSRSSSKPRRGSSANTPLTMTPAITPPSTAADNVSLFLERTRSASGNSTTLPSMPPTSSGGYPNSNLSSYNFNLSTTPATSTTELDLLPPLPMTSSIGTPPLPTSNPMFPPPITSGDVYLYLSTPALPFEPDYYETFSTLCDILIDGYQRVLGLVGTPDSCNQLVYEAFMKADTKVKKLVVTGVVKEFEEACKAAVKREIGGLGKEILGGLL
ncbi:hypothetical protein DFP73DRAFT_526495 [Morchella snyderi]|nr:hypothetical protein DFP73DRAFT_526495 [Morchella snyderi]